MRFEVPDDALAEDHRARLLWRVVETLNLSAFSSDAKAVEGRAGRPLASVKMLLVLWLYGISIGVGSARALERLTKSDDAFRWIVGDQKVSHARLSMFRVGHHEALDGLFTDVLGVLLHRRLLSLDLVAQDGTRIRASATAPSFRRERRVDEALETVKQLHGEGKEAPHWGTPGRGPGQQNHDCTWGPSPPGAGSRSASGWPRSPRAAPRSACRAPRRLALGSPP